MKKIQIPLIILILILLILLSIYLLTLPQKPPQDNNTIIFVTKIIDGDTFQISTNETIRLLCIDAPEKGKKGYEEAKQFLAEMILDKEVRLEKDESEKDEYGRLLRYVYVNISGVEFFVNKQLVQEGYAKVFRYGNDTEKCGEIEGLVKR